MESKKMIDNYCQEVADEFTKSYLKQLDNSIYEMLHAFGFEGSVDDSNEWLESEGYELRMNESIIEDKTRGRRYKRENSL